MRDPALSLKDILESIDLIEQFIAGMEIEDFRTDIKTSDAVIKRFENIGEATKDSVKSFLQILLRALFSRVSIDTIMPQSFESLRPVFA